jgi:hypothetical protein
MEVSCVADVLKEHAASIIGAEDIISTFLHSTGTQKQDDRLQFLQSESNQEEGQT